MIELSVLRSAVRTMSSPSRSYSTYPRHSKVSHYTPSLSTHDTPISYLHGSRVAVHLSELELRLRSRSLREGGVADHESEGLPVERIVSAIFPTLHNSAEVAAYRSGSCCAKTCRLLWSLIILMLVKHPRSSLHKWAQPSACLRHTRGVGRMAYGVCPQY